MFQLDFKLTPQASNAHRTARADTADVNDLRYYLFPGDILLRNDTCNFDAAWEWIPLLDFASAIEQISSELSSQPRKEAQFAFTENDHTLNFALIGNDVAISASYSSCKILVPQVEFANAVGSFVSRLRGEVERLCPEITQNTNYCGLFAKVGVAGSR